MDNAKVMVSIATVDGDCSNGWRNGKGNSQRDANGNGWNNGNGN